MSLIENWAEIQKRYELDAPRRGSKIEQLEENEKEAEKLWNKQIEQLRVMLLGNPWMEEQFRSVYNLLNKYKNRNGPWGFKGVERYYPMWNGGFLDRRISFGRTEPHYWTSIEWIAQGGILITKESRRRLYTNLTLDEVLHISGKDKGVEWTLPVGSSGDEIGAVLGMALIDQGDKQLIKYISSLQPNSSFVPA